MPVIITHSKYHPSVSVSLSFYYSISMKSVKRKIYIFKSSSRDVPYRFLFRFSTAVHIHNINFAEKFNQTLIVLFQFKMMYWPVKCLNDYFRIAPGGISVLFKFNNHRDPVCETFRVVPTYNIPYCLKYKLNRTALVSNILNGSATKVQPPIF